MNAAEKDAVLALLDHVLDCPYCAWEPIYGAFYYPYCNDGAELYKTLFGEYPDDEDSTLQPA